MLCFVSLGRCFLFIMPCMPALLNVSVSRGGIPKYLRLCSPLTRCSAGGSCHASWSSYHGLYGFQFACREV